MGNLFNNQDKATEESYASQVFTESFKGMTGEINRVANEKVTVWSKIVMWIYHAIFGDSNRLKAKQTPEEQMESAEAFDTVKKSFSSVKSKSMNNDQILNHTKKSIP